MTATPQLPASLAEQAYADALRLAQEGDHAAALERHEWFHAHAQKAQPALHGVRLSCALSAWVALGRHYPPALKALRRIRDLDSERLRAGQIMDELFHEVAAINRALGEDAQTVILFRKIEDMNPQAAQRLFRFMIVEARDTAPDLFLRYQPDLLGHYEWMSLQHRELRLSVQNALRITRASQVPASTPPASDPLLKLDAAFVIAVEKLAQLARQTGLPEHGTQMLASALTLVKNLQTSETPRN